MTLKLQPATHWQCMEVIQLRDQLARCAVRVSTITYLKRCPYSQVWSSWVPLEDVILIDKRYVVGKGLPGGRNLTVNSTPTSEKY